MVKKETKKRLWWAGIIAIAIIDVNLTTITGLLPALGDALSGVSHVFWEVTEIALVYGLVNE